MQSKSILLVDNEPRVAIVLARGLQALGDDYTVETAFSSDIALSKSKQQSYNLLIIDCEMPKISGIELIQKISSVSPATKFILMATQGSHELYQKTQALNIEGYLEKPFALTKLREMVTRMVCDG
jgi:DNA-binding NtrC family response regulator